MARKRVAVIDDDALLRSLVDEALTEEGYEVVPLGSAQAAAAALREMVPDLILLDIHMEQRDVGWYLLSLLWLQPVLSTVPVIVSSGDREALARQRAQLQATRCILLNKPYEVQELLDAVERLIGPGQPV